MRRTMSSLLLVGVSHREATVDVREGLAFSRADAEGLISRLLASPAVDEAAVLSTCNRTELYLASPDPGTAACDARAAVLAMRGCDLMAPAAGCQLLTGFDVARHLFRVTSGL